MTSLLITLYHVPSSRGARKRKEREGSCVGKGAIPSRNISTSPVRLYIFVFALPASGAPRSALYPKRVMPRRMTRIQCRADHWKASSSLVLRASFITSIPFVWCGRMLSSCIRDCGGRRRQGRARLGGCGGGGLSSARFGGRGICGSRRFGRCRRSGA